MKKIKGGDSIKWLRGHGVDQEDNSEWFRSASPKSDRVIYGQRAVGQLARVGDGDKLKQRVNAQIEGDDA